MTFCWRADDGPTLNLCDFKGIRTSSAKEPLDFCNFLGGGGGSGPPVSPSGSARGFIADLQVSSHEAYHTVSLLYGLVHMLIPSHVCLHYGYLKCRLLIFSKLTFSKKSGIPLGCQTVWIQIRSDVLSGLIWVRTVSKLTSRLRMLKSLCPRFLEKREMIIRRGMIKTTTIPT